MKKKRTFFNKYKSSLLENSRTNLFMTAWKCCFHKIKTQNDIDWFWYQCVVNYGNDYIYLLPMNLDFTTLTVDANFTVWITQAGGNLTHPLLDSNSTNGTIIIIIIIKTFACKMCSHSNADLEFKTQHYDWSFKLFILA